MKIVILKKANIIYLLLIIVILFIFCFYLIFLDAKPSFSHDIIKNDDKIAYLTFDDGPTIKATPKILDVLKEENVKATFFVIGKYVQKHPEIVKREFDEGHYIANHGYNHDNSKLYKSNDNFLNEIISTDSEIGKAIGIDNYSSHLFRFPNGYMSPSYKSRKKQVVKLLDSINYSYIDWNCLNKDSEKKYSSEQLLNNLKKTSKNKGTLIVLMHDTMDVSNSSAVLKASIDYLRSEGYEFKNFYDYFPLEKN